MAATDPATMKAERVSTSLSDLHDRLDSLWTAYLESLDAYTASQALLQKHMSAGFISLARANFNARDGVRRYGKDFYHERAVATTRVHVSPSEDDSGKARVEVVKRHEPQHGESDGTEDTTSEKDDIADDKAEAKQQPSPPATPEPESKAPEHGPNASKDNPNPDTKDGESSKPKSKPSLEADPLRWFGILIPPALRVSQASFATAVDEVVAESVNAAKRMRECEVEIRKVRKEVRRAEKSGGGGGGGGTPNKQHLTGVFNLRTDDLQAYSKLPSHLRRQQSSRLGTFDRAPKSPPHPQQDLSRAAKLSLALRTALHPDFYSWATVLPSERTPTIRKQRSFHLLFGQLYDQTSTLGQPCHPTNEPRQQAHQLRGPYLETAIMILSRSTSTFNMLLASFTIVFFLARSASCLIVPDRQGQLAYDPFDQILPASPQWEKSFSASSSPDPDQPVQNTSLAKRVVNTYDEAVEVGDYLIAIMNAPLSCSFPSRWTNIASLTAFGWTLNYVRLIDINTYDLSLSRMYAELGLPTDPQVNREYGWYHDQDTPPPGQQRPNTNDQRRYRRTMGGYVNVLNPGAILAKLNFGPEYNGAMLEPPEHPEGPVTGADVVPLRQWSDVVFLQWQEYCGYDPARMSQLRVIVRVGVINEVTKRIALEALERNGEELSDWDHRFTYLTDEDEAKALLATPNAQGVVWFLAQHKNELGRMHVWGVTIFGNTKTNYAGQRSLHLAFHIEPVEDEDTEDGEDEDSADGEDEDSGDGEDEDSGDGEDEDSGDGDEDGESADLAKRIIDYNNDDVQLGGGILDYEEAIEVGEYLTALIDAPPSCVHQSPWTDFAALDAYGWSLKHPRRVNVAELYDPAIVNMYSELELSTALEDNLVINWVHSKVSPPYGKSRPNTNDQRRYPISQGRYQNHYNPGAILAKFNFSPEYKGKSQIPPVRGEDLIPLRQWSDVTFLQWQDYCNDDPEQMRELRAVLRQDVINPVTKDIAFKVLAKNGKELSPWGEGLQLGKDTDGTRAMIATPNGQGIVWFLAQHKRQLGRLEVTGVTVFCNEKLGFGGVKSLNILFRIGPKDGPADWDEDVEMGEGE
ncbi:hypothetical protein LTR37_009415 [Vermiconidia calcicola]|uniref:Uncharacterized protein n=1 Tax=Vermiconidia calcicola TaxID=1690605 RepID=A0ACC3N7X5_9PEZI|nr:hypothetical protein LTR37_009415 [Vermiconidia calcicola]